MVDPTLTISIDRTSLSLSALEFSGVLDSVALGVVGYQPPSLQWRIAYAPDALDVHGSEPVAASYQQAILGFDWCADQAADETAVRTAWDAVAAAIGQFSYTVTTQVSGAPAQVWSAQPGSMTASERTYVDLLYRRPVFAVTIPVYPIPGAP